MKNHLLISLKSGHSGFIFYPEFHLGQIGKLEIKQTLAMKLLFSHFVEFLYVCVYIHMYL